MARLRDNPRRPTVNDVLPPDLWAERARTPDGVHVLEPAPDPVWHGPVAVWTPGAHETNQAVDALTRACLWWQTRLLELKVLNEVALLFPDRSEIPDRIRAVAGGNTAVAADLMSWWPRPASGQGAEQTYAWWQRLGPIWICCDGPDLKPTHAGATLGYSWQWGSWARTSGRMPVVNGRVSRGWVRTTLAEQGGQRTPLPAPPEPLLGY